MTQDSGDHARMICQFRAAFYQSPAMGDRTAGPGIARAPIRASCVFHKFRARTRRLDALVPQCNAPARRRQPVDLSQGASVFSVHGPRLTLRSLDAGDGINHRSKYSCRSRGSRSTHFRFRPEVSLSSAAHHFRQSFVIDTNRASSTHCSVLLFTRRQNR